MPRALGDAHLRWTVADRGAQAKAVTERLTAEKDRMARAAGSRFAVVLLLGRPQIQREYGAFLSNAGIPFIDCTRALVPGRSSVSPPVRRRRRPVKPRLKR